MPSPHENHVPYQPNKSFGYQHSQPLTVRHHLPLTFQRVLSYRKQQDLYLYDNFQKKWYP